MAEPQDPVIVVRCQDCGDVFTLGPDDPRTCPSCGGERLHDAPEPLL